MSLVGTAKFEKGGNTGDQYQGGHGEQTEVWGENERHVYSVCDDFQIYDECTSQLRGDTPIPLDKTGRVRRAGL